MTLDTAALEVARANGAIQLEDGCAPFDVVMHLTSETLTKKLGLKPS